MGIRFLCSVCAKELQTPDGTQGRHVACPYCQTVLEVPFPAAATPHSPQPPFPPVPPAPPIPPVVAAPPPPQIPPVRRPQSNVGYRSDAAALGGSRETKFDDRGEFNPYAAPQADSSAQDETAFDDPRRKGPPWERKGAGISAFFATAQMVIFSPDRMFRTMRLHGGHGPPIWFMLFGSIIGTIFGHIYSYLFEIAFVTIGKERLAAVHYQYAASTICICFCGIPFSIGFVYLWALIANLLLMIVANVPVDGKRFEATLRVLCYVWGSIGLCQIVPILGGCWAFVALVYGEIYGFSRVHGVSPGKSALVVCLPYAVFIGLAFCAFLLIVGLVGFEIMRRNW